MADLQDLYGVGDLTDEEIALIIGEAPGRRSRLEEQRQMGQLMRSKGTLGSGVRAPGVFVSESPLSAIGDVMSRYAGRKQEREATTGLEGLETGDKDRMRVYIDRMRRQAQEQGGGPQMSPVPQQGPQGALTPFGNPNATPGMAMPPQQPPPQMGPPAPTPPPPQMGPPAPGPTGPMDQNMALKMQSASPVVGGPGQAPAASPAVNRMAGNLNMSPEQYMKIQAWLEGLRR